MPTPQGPGGAFDHRGWTLTSHARTWPTDRLLEGFITQEIRDAHGDVIELGAIEEVMPWVGEFAVISYKHGYGGKGFVPLGKILAWKREGDKLKIRAGIVRGSKLIDDIWSAEIAPFGVNGGFSVGGQVLQRICQAGKNCRITKVDIVEVAWTPSPANPGARVTAVAVAKSAQLGDLLPGEPQAALRAFAFQSSTGELTGPLSAPLRQLVPLRLPGKNPGENP